MHRKYVQPLACAVRVLDASIAHAVGPALWWTPSRELRAAAASACNALEPLDVYPPLLLTPSPAATAIAQLLGTLPCIPTQLDAISRAASLEQTTRSRRGWEKTAATMTSVVPPRCQINSHFVGSGGEEYRGTLLLTYITLVFIYGCRWSKPHICSRLAG